MSGPTSGISLGVVSKRTPLVDNSAPSGAVASLAAIAGGPHSIALTWTAKAGARRYRVERSLNGSTGWALVDYPTTNSYTDTGLTPVTEYFYRVRAQNAAGAAAYSSTANATTSSAALIDLVAGWALTAGPQQTMNSSGVVASGPLDLTDQGSPASASYTADGMVPAAPVNPYDIADLLCDPALGASIDASSSWMLSCRCQVDAAHDLAGHQGAVRVRAPNPGYQLEVNGGTDQFFYAEMTDDNSEQAFSNPNGIDEISVSTPHVIVSYYDATRGMLGVVLDDGAPSESLVAGQFSPDWTITQGAGPALHVLARYAGSFIGQLRLWIGPNAATLAADAPFQAWLVNSGAGRTDAELAVYAP